MEFYRFILSILCFLFVVPISVIGQQAPKVAPKNIEGIVIFADEKEPVENATVQLLKASDSTVVISTATDKGGKFLFSNIKAESYLLKTSYVSFETQFQNIAYDMFKNKSIDIPVIALEENSILLSDAVVVGKIPEMIVKEDTIEYNPAAFNLHENSLVEDLLKRLPGVEVDMEGNITMAGKSIGRVTVDGENFFGRDPKMTTQNLEIGIIDKLQVIEKKSDLEEITGIDDGKRETIINITIKEDKKRGWINNIQAGVGNLTKDISLDNTRYESRSMFNRFVGDNKYSLVINANNTSERGQGVNSNESIGLNMINVFNPKFKMIGDLSYNSRSSFVQRESFRQNILVDSVSYRKNESESRNNNQNISLNYRFEYKPSDKTTVLFTPNVSFSTSHSNDTSYTATMAGDAEMSEVNNSTRRGSSNSKNFNMSGSMLISHGFAKKGRRVTLNMYGNLGNNNQLGYNQSVSEFSLMPERNQYLNQEAKTITESNSFSINTSYIEPLLSSSFLQLSYDLRKNMNHNKRNTYEYNIEDDDYTVLNPEYSKSLLNSFFNQTISLSFRTVKEKYTYNAGLGIVPSYIKSKSYIRDGVEVGVDSVVHAPDGREVVNYSPNGEFIYRFSKDANLRLSYNGNTSQPSISQLDPTEDLTNPLNIRSGNPDLLPSFSNNMNMVYNFSDREKQQSLRANISYGFVLNQIINRTIYESNTGVQRTMPINQNGMWNSNANILYSTPLDKKKRFQFSTSTDVSLRNQIGYMSFKEDTETKNVSKTFSISENISISYRREWLYLQARGVLRYSSTNNSLEAKKNQEDVNYRASLNSQVDLPSDWVVESIIQYAGQSGLSTGYNRNETIWNIYLNKRFMKNKQATVSLKWTDVLQQRMSIRRNVTSNYIEDSESNVLTGYFMVSFAYRFNSFGDGGGRSNRGGDRMRGSRGGGGMRSVY